ncbi:hypothetical protein G6F57_001100 [Rhizopus arrhizus]|uniref:glucan 1,4-alpha-glucosidase n=1 Tax=Rhizopus oryzae TaxID=64495 RepID=A0A9P7BX32_RHIOR|nr:hypothetical protein G6F23_003053 [Rhizopus arrhizus]KAG1420104.1 hypothetical protein G6F58_004321 [Rhizopus delemar]KAG0788941.1 hypothetical protein G6F21_006855 [Rhizopus arrhizus]KAG0801228.1 hypothetical protein G6F22_001454 [Rhizopus arrhizus]KAG0809664.1 hypothetical protein G6F20_008596 [Rhizopus arrhizus]
MSISFKTILKNIHPPGTTRGFLAASLSTSHPDYFYTWTRDAALVVRVLCDLPETEDNLLKDYVEFQVDTQNTPTVCQCLGEPKFNPDGSAFSGPWGRPQNDGPAERAITFMKIINRFKGKHDDFIKKTIMTALKKDLDYTVRVWEEPCFDLWEEYQSTANDIQKRLETFWSPEENYIKVTQDEQSGVNKTSGLDVSVLLAASAFSSIGEGFFTPASDKILATAAAIERAFLNVYSINKDLKTGLGTAIGRYPEDVYDGYEKSKGNPWFLATAAYAELYYLAIEEWKQKGIEINKVNKPFFERIAPFDYGTYAPNSDQWQQIISKVSTEADKFLATVQFHQQTNGSMSEQFNRNTGRMQGARDLTWSHAAFISAVKAKEGLPITPVITSK